MSDLSDEAEAQYAEHLADEHGQLRLGTPAQELLIGNTDAKMWAREFRAYFGGVHLTPVMTMDKLIAWFATAIEAGRAAGYGDGYASGLKDGKRGRITMDEARDLAETYEGGESSHPLARHRDSMG